jgi:hypothetical protein
MVSVEDVLSYFGSLLNDSISLAYVFKIAIIASDLIETTFLNRKGFIQFIID